MTSPSVAIALQTALSHATIERDSFNDIVYYLYSTRYPSGKVGRLRAVYANSKVLQAAGQHFRGQLSAGFSSKNQLPEDTNDYDCDSDSDLEDAWDGTSHPDTSKPSTIPPTGKEKVSTSHELLPTDLHHSVHENIEVEDETGAASSSSDHLSLPTADHNCKHSIAIADIAANTWRALIFYIYTQKIQFAPLRSQDSTFRLQEMKRHLDDNPHCPPLCSPKSMYRLADIIGLTELSNLAENDIRSKMNQTTVLNEVFSRFSSRYPDILQLEVDYLSDEGMPHGNVMLNLQQQIKNVVQGELPHAANALMSLVQKIPTNVANPVSCGQSVPDTPDEEMTTGYNTPSVSGGRLFGGKKAATKGRY